MSFDPDEMVEKLMALPIALQEQISRNTDAIVKLINHQEIVMETICKLHDIDLDELKKELQSITSKVKKHE